MGQSIDCSVSSVKFFKGRDLSIFEGQWEGCRSVTDRIEPCKINILTFQSVVSQNVTSFGYRFIVNVIS